MSTAAPIDSAPVAELGEQAPPAPAPAPAAARAERGATTSNILEALAKGGTMTAGEVALATGMGRGTISSTLSRLTRTGQVRKADRGYQLADASAKLTAKRPAAKPRAATKARTAPGATKAKVLAALSTDGGLTATDVAIATGLARGTVSTTLSKLAKNGEVVKAQRGYRLPG